MKGKGLSRETAWAKEAFTRYLLLPKPRSLSDLAGVCLRTKGRKESPPLRISTLRNWHYAHSWEERAAQWDDEMLAAERERVMQWRFKEAEKRERERLEGATVQRQMAIGYLVYPEDAEDVPEEQRGKPRPLASCEPGLLQLADRFLKTAAEVERADLGAIARAQEKEHDERAGGGPVIVVTNEGLDQLRGIVEQLQDKQPKTAIPDVIDAEFSKTG